MSDDWMRPITKPLPGPVTSEASQMDIETQNRVARAGDEGAHFAAGHTGRMKDCKRCKSEPRVAR